MKVVKYYDNKKPSNIQIEQIAPGIKISSALETKRGLLKFKNDAIYKI